MLTADNLMTKRPYRSLEAGQPNLYKGLKNGIWVYLLLLLFEGALRKWFLPALSTPLLLVRDPIAIWLVLSALKRGLLTFNIYLAGMVFIGFVSFFTAIFLGHKNLEVAIFGTRIFLFHFPVIFVIGRVLNRDDVIAIGKFLLWITIPMTVLVALQFYSPQSAWVNRGVGGDMAGAGFSGSNGYFRPPGTFSFITGTVQFYGLIGCFVLYFLINQQGINKLALYGSLIGLLASVPLSISRTMLFQVILAGVFLLLITVRKPKYLGRMVVAFVALILAFVILSHSSFFLTATDAFSARFEIANENEGGLKGVFIDRFLGGMIGALTSSTDLPFFGYGVGIGTNVGSKLLTGSNTFLVSEEEWGRLIGELGPLMGILVIIFRVGFSFKISKACYSKMTTNNFLPWMLLSFGFISILQGQWAQPTSLGFSVIIAGFILAALKDAPVKEDSLN
jgi:hypothetical protein